MVGCFNIPINKNFASLLIDKVAEEQAVPGDILYTTVGSSIVIGSGKTSTKPPLKNTVSICIKKERASNGNDRYQVKLSNNNVHLTGIKDEEEAMRVAAIIVSKLNVIQKVLVELNRDRERAERLFIWIAENCMAIIYSEGVAYDYVLRPTSVPEEFAFASYLLKVLALCKDNSGVMGMLTFFRTFPLIYEESEELTIERIVPCNFNVKYRLPGSIIKDILAEKIKAFGFNVNYTNIRKRSSGRVCIYLNYDLEELGDILNYIKKKKNQHSFVVTESGDVTQSGPMLELMAGAYTKFIKSIDSIWKEIAVTR
jgi:hypothetical protein